MAIPLELLQGLFDRALSEFFEREAEALVVGVNERNSCGRLAVYLDRKASDAGLAGYFADTEYNRKQGGQIKTILDGNMQVITINCDLILHSRGVNIAEDNLIAVEMKKANRPTREKDADRNRLRAMTKSSFDGIWENDGTTQPEHVCGYRLGAYIELHSSARVANLEYFMRGEQTGSETRQY